MNKKLSDKIAVITGGNRGIGLETAKLFKSEGADLALFGRDEADMKQAIQDLGGSDLGFVGDVTSEDDLNAFFTKIKEKYGRIDVLFINAGISQSSSIPDTTHTFYDNLFDINVKGAFFSVQKALPLMGPGSSVCLTTSNVQHIGYPQLAIYSASKAALGAFVRSFAAELLERGIRVNAVSPGPIDTTLLTKNMSADVRAEVMKNIADNIPMRRMGKATEVAKAVLFLASEDSSFMTGEEIIVDGGVRVIGENRLTQRKELTDRAVL